MDEVPATGALPHDFVPAGQARDEVGQVETRGIDYIPRRERNSHPRHLTWAMFGPQFGFGNMVFGSLPVAFGLSWWSSVAAITLGVLVGSIIFAGVCFQS